MTTLSLEISKKLYELIGEYESEFQWKGHEDPNKNECFGWTLLRTNEKDVDWDREFPASTFAELIRDVLPKLVLHGSFSWRASRNMISVDLCRLYRDAPTEPEGMKAVEDYLKSLFI